MPAMIRHTTSTMRGEVNAAVYIPSKPCSIRAFARFAARSPNWRMLFTAARVRAEGLIHHVMGSVVGFWTYALDGFNRCRSARQ